MLNFGTETSARRGEAIVPMINVVFLLLIFFLMTARLTPPEPFLTTPPRAGGGTSVAGATLYLSAEGVLAYGAERGEAVHAALSANGTGAVLLRADAGASAAHLAKVVARLTAQGHGPVRLVTVPR
ncbi:outer membrane transport energization protein ExbD [Rhodovulum bhavnagarense]|uniref:Outer membrane transport energization protein ExbD n=1 Tax=Rhodovulum bhavnagarense TaxID=992286 RepID=A0A4R2RHN5_9RHOB|nr:biopolymer transporter ExbD [Rhodovulum bhavnagarense]TCP61959.1 outer membrane transport energization protein ExbD [Rhodovulum bhavnagarense]